MLNKYIFKYFLFLVPVLTLMFTGCTGSSAPSRFYALNSMDSAGRNIEKVSQEENTVIAVGPVLIPDYLNRPQIVVRTGRNELTLSEFDRWPGSLEEEISRVLLDNLSILLDEKEIFVMPWKRAIPSAYKVAVNINSLDIYMNNHVILKANWIITGKEGEKLIIIKDKDYKEPVQGNDYSSAVRAMDKALLSLSSDMAETIADKLTQIKQENNSPDNE